jgi:hypothetical protein
MDMSPGNAVFSILHLKELIFQFHYEVGLSADQHRTLELRTDRLSLAGYFA